jgi:hypothetical protein
LSTYWNIGNNGNPNFFQNLGISHSGPFEYLRASKSASSDHNKLVCLDGFVHWFRKRDLWLVVAIWLILDANGARRSRFVENDSNDLGISKNVKIRVISVLQEGMNVAVGCILTLPIWGDITVPMLSTISRL